MYCASYQQCWLFFLLVQSSYGADDNQSWTKISFEKKLPYSLKLEIAQGLIDTENPGTVVGSSRGGAVAMALDLKGAELVLIAPAWRRFGVAPYVPINTTIKSSAQSSVCC